MAAACKLFVGNLPWETEDAALQQLFGQCGNVVKCEIPKGRQGRSRGYGIVEYSTPHEAQVAVQQLHGAAARAGGARARGVGVACSRCTRERRFGMHAMPARRRR